MIWTEDPVQVHILVSVSMHTASGDRLAGHAVVDTCDCRS